MIARLAALALACGALPAAALAHAAAQGEAAVDYRAAAQALEPLINHRYAYPERLPGGRFVLSATLAAERDAVRDGRSLLAFTERALMLLADHHAITSSSFGDSYALVPSYADLWVEPRGGAYRITAVRSGSPAAMAGVREGAELVAVGGVPMADAVAAFWGGLGTTGSGERDGFAARVLAAGRRDGVRDLIFRNPGDKAVRRRLVSLYDQRVGTMPPVTLQNAAITPVITINNALGDDATIAAFDQAMLSVDPAAPIEIDLTNTPGGGNTHVARGIMGWFAAAPTPYQRHALPSAVRDTGIAREWLELVLPRPGVRRHSGQLTVRVGRWTGSMGEGLALGLGELGATVCGTKMAGLLGAVEDLPLGTADLTIKLPVERLMQVDGTPRETFAPPPCAQPRR
ncbi:MAG: peptidase S41 [Pelagerythrobacter marensis]|nr:MAG: peptidase S41 [Pelagerythrobacter marensis]